MPSARSSSIPFAREIARICELEAEELDDRDPAWLERLAEMAAGEPHHVIYQCLSEERALAKRGGADAAHLRELARCLRSGRPSDRLLYPDIV